MTSVFALDILSKNILDQSHYVFNESAITVKSPKVEDVASNIEFVLSKIRTKGYAHSSSILRITSGNDTFGFFSLNSNGLNGLKYHNGVPDYSEGIDRTLLKNYIGNETNVAFDCGSGDVMKNSGNRTMFIKSSSGGYIKKIVVAVVVTNEYYAARNNDLVK